MSNDIKTAFSEIVTTSGEVTTLIVSDEDKLRIVISNAGVTNTIVVSGRILEQDDWDIIKTITSNCKEVLNISTYDYVKVECTTFDSLNGVVKVIASSFNSAGGATEIGVPTGDLLVKDTEVISFTSSNSSIIITGDNTLKTVDFVAIVDDNVTDLVTLSGVAAGSTDLGSFTGTTIIDGSDNKEALQALETAVETKQDALPSGNSMQYLRGDKTFQTLDSSVVFENVQLYFTDTRARTASVSDTITDEVTNIAPSQNAVFDALALKQDNLGFTAVPDTRTVNGHALSSDVTVTKTDVGLENVPNIDATVASNITQDSTHRFTNDTDITRLANTSGTNTGDQDLSLYSSHVANTLNPHSVTKTQVGLSNVQNTDTTTTVNIMDSLDKRFVTDANLVTIGNQTGINTGDQIASTVPNTPSGTISAITVQAAINELDTEKASVAYVDAQIGAGITLGDISLTSFAAVNNQSSPIDITGFTFAVGVVRGFKALVSVSIDATVPLYETFELLGIQKTSGFVMAVDSVGDNSGVVFSITSDGKIQYTSSDITGFLTNEIQFRSQVTHI